VPFASAKLINPVRFALLKGCFILSTACLFHLLLAVADDDDDSTLLDDDEASRTIIINQKKGRDPAAQSPR